MNTSAKISTVLSSAPSACFTSHRTDGNLPDAALLAYSQVMRSIARAFAMALLFSGAAGCMGKNLREPGESLGFYSVAGTLHENSCGDAPTPWNFRVELRKEKAPEARLFWSQGDIPVGAALGADGKAAFTTESQHIVRAATQKDPGCAVTRKDSVALTLDPSNQKFTGTLRYGFTIEDGSTCGDLSAAGITQAPCSVNYDIQGTATGETK